MRSVHYIPRAPEQRPPFEPGELYLGLLDVAERTGIDPELIVGPAGESEDDAELRRTALEDMLATGFITPADIANASAALTVSASLIDNIQDEDEPEALLGGRAA